MPVRWDAEYDVVVMGMGAAGMVAAKTAADNGAKVVIAGKVRRGQGRLPVVGGRLCCVNHFHS
ncbi:MAG: FAD-binding protein [Faecalibacterium sp.]